MGGMRNLTEYPGLRAGGLPSIDFKKKKKRAGVFRGILSQIGTNVAHTPDILTHETWEQGAERTVNLKAWACWYDTSLDFFAQGAKTSR